MLDFTNREAKLAAALFERAGRIRRTKVDAMIAATALVAEARLATRNIEGFRVFDDVDLV